MCCVWVVLQAFGSDEALAIISGAQALEIYLVLFALTSVWFLPSNVLLVLVICGARQDGNCITKPQIQDEGLVRSVPAAASLHGGSLH